MQKPRVGLKCWNFVLDVHPFLISGLVHFDRDVEDHATGLADSFIRIALAVIIIH